MMKEKMYVVNQAAFKMYGVKLPEHLIYLDEVDAVNALCDSLNMACIMDDLMDLAYEVLFYEKKDEKLHNAVYRLAFDRDPGFDVYEYLFDNYLMVTFFNTYNIEDLNL